MFNIKDVRCKPQRLPRSTYLLEYGRHVARFVVVAVVVVGRTRPRSMPLAMLAVKKEMHGFLFLCMHVVPFLMVMVLRLATLGAAGARYKWVPANLMLGGNPAMD